MEQKEGIIVSQLRDGAEEAYRYIFDHHYPVFNYFYLLTLQHAIQIDKTTSVSTIAGDDSTNDLMGTGTT